MSAAVLTLNMPFYLFFSNAFFSSLVGDGRSIDAHQQEQEQKISRVMHHYHICYLFRPVANNSLSPVPPSVTIRTELRTTNSSIYDHVWSKLNGKRLPKQPWVYRICSSKIKVVSKRMLSNAAYTLFFINETPDSKANH